MHDYTVRPETAHDINSISSIVEAAFGQVDEAVLVQNLRADGDLTLSLVADRGGTLLGHVGLSRMRAAFPALGLAPVSVHPEHQRRGIGKALIQVGLALARSQGWAAVFVLGDPDYYRQFGFSTDLASGFTTPYAGTSFMVLPLQSSLPEKSGPIDYAAAFQAL